MEYETIRNSIYKQGKEFLISKLHNSPQEADLSIAPNCDGFGRLREFKRNKSDWPSNALPLDPAFRALNLPFEDRILVQIFQIAACNAHCWYCFVPDEMKTADETKAKWFTAKGLLDLFEKSEIDAKVIDLSGGNPELVPEWTIHMMREIERRNLNIYLWSDDTLTTDYTFSVLSKDDINYLVNYRKYGKVCCLKGFDEETFAFNSGLSPHQFENQLLYLKKYVDLGLDVYGYFTMTCPNTDHIERKIRNIMDKLQAIHAYMPLRFSLLKIVEFSPVKARMHRIHEDALGNQYVAMETWYNELNRRFSTKELSTRVCDINIWS